MKKLLLCLSALLAFSCSGGGGSGGGGVTAYQYQASGVAPFSASPVVSRATSFVVKWNENNGVITGIYTADGETKAVTGTSTGAGRQINLIVDPPESGVSKIRLELPAGAMTGSVSATIKGLDALDNVLSSSPITLTATTDAGEGSGTTVAMPTISCPSGVSPTVPVAGNMIELILANTQQIHLCIKASNHFTFLNDPSVTDATYTYTTPSSFVGNLTANWSNETSIFKAAFCFGQYSTSGTFAANISDEGTVSSTTGTFTIYASSSPSCP